MTLPSSLRATWRSTAPSADWMRTPPSCEPLYLLLATLVAAGLRISELCLLDGEDLDFAGRRIYVPRMRKDHGRLVRVQGIKTEAAERVIPMLLAVYDLLLEHKAEFDFGAHDPVFANRNGQRNAVDNVRRTIVERLRSSAPTSSLPLAASARSRTCTPHTLRRTFASILAEVNLPPRRAMHLLGHTTRRSRCASISRSSTWGRAASIPSSRPSAAPSPRPSHCCQAGELCHPIGTRPGKRPPSSVDGASWKAQKRLRPGGLSEAAEGTRTLDLLHGKQTL
jgi:integrase-like protein